MAQNNPYEMLLVESYEPVHTSGLHGSVHIRPVDGQGYRSTMHVECSKNLCRDHPIGTRFRIKAKLTDREGGGQYLYSHWRWPVEVVEPNSN